MTKSQYSINQESIKVVKRLALMSCLVTVLVTPLVRAQSPSHPFEALRGLERFNKSSSLSLDNTSQAADTLLSIKGVKIGDNVLLQAIKLAEQGGQLGRIRGGTRSEKIKFNFSQPYENTRLEQKVELYFDKYNGFIQQVTATYVLQNAYLSIVPIREQTLNAAVAKFGSPMTMQQAYDLSGQLNGEIEFDKFIQGIQSQLHPLGLEYFQKRNISRSSKWVKGDQDYALMHSGFDRCYLWHANAFNQILTLCFFDDTSANPNSRGIELDLHDFPVSQQIKELGNPHTKPDISL
tara:strand:- start:809 stop:1687 length:879 start_codon:yes stop_codon:yes gene_type:complete